LSGTSLHAECLAQLPTSQETSSSTSEPMPNRLNRSAGLTSDPARRITVTESSKHVRTTMLGAETSCGAAREG
jgi:hypothetical protein